MKKYGVNELRRMYLSFFESKGHLVMKSFSLVPHNDDSLLLINAGMAPLKPYFTGQETPPRKRVTTCQKCVRTGDIENVGKTARHLTFFEMLGNFSFGDYFKREALHWSWEFLTEVIGMDPGRLYPSIYFEDEEAFHIWTDEIGVPAEKIKRFYRDPVTGECDNFWEHGAGPCGPCSEIYYDRGEKYGCGKPTCGVGCDCDRYMEIWNDVFTQFENDGHGNYTELKQKNIDTGMGLERLAVVVQDVDTVFDIDTMKAIRDKVCEMAGVEYEMDPKADVSIRLITDHIRSATFMISDGIMPSNEGRGYVLRRLIRRIARHGRLLGIRAPFISQIADVVIECSKDGYPELEEKRGFIFTILDAEEAQFGKTLDQGMNILGQMAEKTKEEGKTVLSGDDAFKLYDTYGFPLDLTVEILEDQGITVDEDGFQEAMEEQRQKARETRKTSNYMGKAASVYDDIDNAITSEFTGYGNTEDKSEILVLTTEVDPENGLYGEITQALTDGQKGTVITAKTPFYGEMGGQVGDTGVIETKEGTFEVENTIHLLGGRIGHVGHMTSGVLRSGEEAALKVDAARRASIAKNHSATHLLQKALQEVLGSHVQQKGSYVDENYLRFDFVHFSAMTKDEIHEVEKRVNERIAANVPVDTQVMTLDEAKKTGAMALFGEKYGDKVRVVKMGDYSTELCGGTHVARTGDIQVFKLLSESASAAGVRRVEAVTGFGAIRYFDSLGQQLEQAADAAKSSVKELPEKIQHMQEEIKALQGTVESMKSKAASQQLGDVSDKVKKVGGVDFIGAKVSGVDQNGLRDLGDKLRSQMGDDAVVLLVSDNGGKVSLVAMATDGAVKKGAHAGNLVKMAAKLVGGGGGGRPNMAQAGGKNPEGIDQALEEAEKELAKQLGL